MIFFSVVYTMCVIRGEKGKNRNFFKKSFFFPQSFSTEVQSFLTCVPSLVYSGCGHLWTPAKDQQRYVVMVINYCSKLVVVFYHFVNSNDWVGLEL